MSDPDWSELYLAAKAALAAYEKACQDEDQDRATTAAGDLAIVAQRMRAAAQTL